MFSTGSYRKGVFSHSERRDFQGDPSKLTGLETYSLFQGNIVYKPYASYH
jgi:hypothetical protein